MATEITVEAFVTETKKQLERFAQHWNENLDNKEVPYPKTLELEEWDEQFVAFSESSS